MEGGCETALSASHPRFPEEARPRPARDVGVNEGHIRLGANDGRRRHWNDAVAHKSPTKCDTPKRMTEGEKFPGRTWGFRRADSHARAIMRNRMRTSCSSHPVVECGVVLQPCAHSAHFPGKKLETAAAAMLGNESRGPACRRENHGSCVELRGGFAGNDEVGSRRCSSRSYGE